MSIKLSNHPKKLVLNTLLKTYNLLAYIASKYGDNTGLNIRRKFSFIIEPTIKIVLKSLSSNVINIEGFKIDIKNKDTERLSYLNWTMVGYEKGTTKVFKDILKTGDNVIDIGAQLGYYSLLASKIIGEKGKVYAFEPEPENYKWLLRNIKLNNNKNIVPLEEAVSNKEGSQRFNIDWHNASHSLYSTPRQVGSTVVKLTTLDKAFKKPRIKLVKIDVQGAEADIIEGASNFLKINPDVNIILEWWNEGFERAKKKPESFFKTLQDLGFKIYFIKENNGEIILLNKYSDLKKLIDEKLGCNILCKK